MKPYRKPGTDAPDAAGTASLRQYAARRANPAGHYADPTAVVDDQSLTRAQRLQLLHDWAQDLVDQQIASGEGMIPNVPGIDGALLRQVNICIETVESMPTKPANIIVQLWRRVLAR
jgi:hypothetical protein